MRWAIILPTKISQRQTVNVSLLNSPSRNDPARAILLRWWLTGARPSIVCCAAATSLFLAVISASIASILWACRRLWPPELRITEVSSSSSRLLISSRYGTSRIEHHIFSFLPSQCLFTELMFTKINKLVRSSQDHTYVQQYRIGIRKYWLFSYKQKEANWFCWYYIEKLTYKVLNKGSLKLAGELQFNFWTWYKGQSSKLQRKTIRCLLKTIF